jgi:hypothetical protein
MSNLTVKDARDLSFLTRDQAVDIIIRLMEERDACVSALRHLLEMTGEPPDKNCSCHISPPCNDCVDHSGWRDAFDFANSSIAKATGEQP